MTVVSTLEVMIGANISSLSRGLRQAERALDTSATTMENRLQSLGGRMQNFGAGMSLFTAPLAAGLYASVDAAIEFESAFAGVEKTVDATDAELAVLRDGIRDMATDMDSSVSGLENAHITLAQIAESAGQLGVASEDIDEFTQTIAMLDGATNLTAESAATMSAQFANITDMDMSNIDEMSSTVVALGNNGASTEAQILSLSLRIAAAADSAGYAEDEILGLSSAMASLGIEEEAGGTAMSRTINEIARAAALGTPELQGFADVAGLTSDQFAELATNDPAEALTRFVEGLGKLDAASQINVLENLGLDDVRVQDTLRRLAGDSDGLRESLNLASDAWRENTALTEEAAARASTTESKLNALTNNANDLAISLGDVLTPKIAELAATITPVLQRLNEWVKANPELAGNIALVAAALVLAGPALMLAGTLISAIGTAAGLAKVGLMALLSPVGMILAGFGVLLTAGGTLDDFLADVGRLAGEAGTGFEGFARAVVGIPISLISRLVEAIDNLSAIDIAGGLAAWTPALEAAGLALSIVFDRIKRGIEVFVLDVQTRILGFLSTFRQDILNATGGSIDIAPNITFDLAGIQNKLNDMQMADTLTTALQNQLASGDIDLSAILPENGLPVDSLFKFNPEQIAQHLSVEGRQAVQNAINMAISTGDEEAFSAMVPLASELDMDIEALRVQMQDSIAASAALDYMADLVVDLILYPGTIDVSNIEPALVAALGSGAGADSIGRGVNPAMTPTAHGGRDIQRDGLYYLRTGEEVLSPSDARGGRGGTIINQYQNVVYGENPYELARMLERAERDMAEG